MPDEDYQRPDGFDLDGDWDQDGDPRIEDIAAQFGWSDWRDVIAPEGGYDEVNVRPGGYHTIEDAILEAYNVGILGFSTFWYDFYDDEWHIIVDEESG